MARDPAVTNRLNTLIAQLVSLTKSGQLHWERQLGSAHRYARWKNNLLILGPAEPISDTKIQRYLFVTPFDSPACVEVNSGDEELGSSVMELVATVEQMSKDEPPTDPFALTDEVLGRLSS
ncbi:MAG TPA: hypothetical protein VF961_00545 [Pyrinomonadaceae bacterium]